MKRAIVTGANGFVGRHLVTELTKSGYEVWAVVRNEDSKIRCLSGAAPHIVYCDLREIQTLPQKMHADMAGSCFYHLAWTGSSGPERTDCDLQLKNAVDCVHAARAAREIGCSRFVGAGSVTELMYRDYLHQDGSRPEMVTCYSIGKMAAEYMTRCECAETGLDFLWAYISNFYGVGDQTQNFINFLLRHYLVGDVPDLTAGNQDADFIYVSDVALALLHLGERGRPWCNYYVGYGNPRPLHEFVAAVRDAVYPGLETGLGHKEFRGISIDFNKVDIDKLYRDTNFIPVVPFKTGLQKVLKWIQESNDGLVV